MRRTKPIDVESLNCDSLNRSRRGNGGARLCEPQQLSRIRHPRNRRTRSCTSTLLQLTKPRSDQDAPFLCRSHEHGHGKSACEQVNFPAYLRAMGKATDIRTVSAGLYFLPVQSRIPLKFGHETLTHVTC